MANLVETAAQAGLFSTLLSAVEAAGLGDILTNSDRLTLLAPTDEAFAKLPAGTVESLLQDIPKLKRILTYHVLFGDVRSEDLRETDEAPTVEGSIVAVTQVNDTIQVNEAKVVQADILTDNGVIHVIDTVLIPALVAGH